MNIIDTQYGKFEEVNHLNKNFLPDTNKMRLTIDTISSKEAYEQIYPMVLKQFTQLFPRLKKHSCCNISSKEGGQNRNINGPLSRTNNYFIDVIHLIEHVMIDLQCSLSGIKICSGITCNFRNPRNRYDIFIECVDEQVGYYSAQLTIDIVQRLLSNNYCQNIHSNFVSVENIFHDQAKEGFKMALQNSSEIFSFDLGRFLLKRMMNFEVKVN